MENDLSMHVHFGKNGRFDNMLLLVEENSLRVQAGQRRFNDRGQWGHYSCFEVYGVGFMFRLANLTILNRKVTFHSKPIQPVLTLHVQVANESYCSLAGGETKLLVEDNCSLFVQGEEPFECLMLQGGHTQFDLYFRQSWLAEKAALFPALNEHVFELKSGETDTAFYTNSITAGREFEQVLNSLIKEGSNKKPVTKHLDAIALNLLSFFIC
jgi:hypothetical protein